MIRSSRIQRPQHVLIVDDQELNRDILGVILEEDYELLYAANGREAISVMRERQKDVSIVLPDPMMPAQRL